MGIYDFDGVSALRELQLPKGIHLFQAEKDEIIPGSLYEKMNSALQTGNGNSTRIIPGAKHDLTEGKPEEIKSLADQIKGIYQK
jgi:pimeloyl-ACP methyl ester carboxylesterase